MRKQMTPSYRFETSSLFSLKMVLTNARRALPPRIAGNDASDELARGLTTRMKQGYKKQSARGKESRIAARAGIE
jgi:hypothetical protein